MNEISVKTENLYNAFIAMSLIKHDGNFDTESLSELKSFVVLLSMLRSNKPLKNEKNIITFIA